MELKTQDARIVGLGSAHLVASASRPGEWHAVENGRCTCPGFTYRGTCRHVKVVSEQESAERAEQERQAANRRAYYAELQRERDAEFRWAWVNGGPYTWNDGDY